MNLFMGELLMGEIPDWLEDPPKRKRSVKQEKKLAKKYQGRTTANSGATFGQNDITTKDLSIEAKYTDNKGYRVNVPEFLKAATRAEAGKIPVEIIEFSNYGETLVVIRESDFLTLIGSE